MYKIAVIGAGPGGYVAALRAARLGAKVALIENSEVGGVCLNSGCIPTKSIIASINRLRAIKASGEMGISISGEVGYDISEIISRKDSIVSRLVKGIHQLIKAGKIDLYNGFATINSDKSITVGDQNIEADNIVIATGSKWKTIPGIEIDSKLIVTSDDMLNMEDVPKRVIILGGGIVGCEFASILSELGAEVTIVEALPSLISQEDTLTTKALMRSFKKQGIKSLVGVTLESAEKQEDSVRVKLSNGEEIEADKLFVAVGRKPNTQNMGFENIDLEIENGAIKTNEKMETNVANVYAIGDVNGKYMLAHVASEEGIVAVNNIMGKVSTMSYDAIPRPVYTYPEICCVGKTEKELQEAGAQYNTGRFAFSAIGKALCDGETEGQAIVYSDNKTSKILGAQIVGNHSTEFSSELTLAIRNGLSVHDVANTIHSHPTLSEIVKEAVEDCEELAIHKVYRQR